MKLPGFERKLRVALDWTLDLFFDRDIVYLRPLHASRGPAAVSHQILDDDGPACIIAGQSDSSEVSALPMGQTSRVLQATH